MSLLRRVEYFVFLWRRHWGSAFAKPHGSREVWAAMRAYHRAALLWMLRHPLRATRSAS